MTNIQESGNDPQKKRQCKVPLFPTSPGIHICIKEYGHEGLHHTYGRDDIYFTARGRD